MKVRNFKELHADMRDNQDIYPKRGSSKEELCVQNLIDVIHYFDTIKSNVSSNLFIRDKNVYDSFKFFEQIMHQKFDLIEELLKECNIENFEREYKEINEKTNNKR